jgi:hypothetical protein
MTNRLYGYGISIRGRNILGALSPEEAGVARRNAWATRGERVDSVDSQLDAVHSPLTFKAREKGFR